MAVVGLSYRGTAIDHQWMLVYSLIGFPDSIQLIPDWYRFAWLTSSIQVPPQ